MQGENAMAVPPEPDAVSDTSGGKIPTSYLYIMRDKRNGNQGKKYLQASMIMPSSRRQLGTPSPIPA